MDYRLVFDVTRSQPDDSWWLSALLPLVGMVLTLHFLFGERLGIPEAPRPVSAEARRLAAAASAVFTVLTALLTWGDFRGARLAHTSLCQALLAGRCQVLEGAVNHFDPMPYADHKQESFEVAGQRFAFSDYSTVPGYHRTYSHGSLVKEGVQVRLWHRGNDIARLEVGR